MMDDLGKSACIVYNVQINKCILKVIQSAWPVKYDMGHALCITFKMHLFICTLYTMQALFPRSSIMNYKRIISEL